MIKTKLQFLYLLVLLPFVFSEDPIAFFCSNTTPTNPLQSNINFVLTDLINRTPQSNYAISSHGNNIYGLTRCRGDIPSDICSTCITTAANQLPSLCPNRTDARVWYDYCFLRYDIVDFIGKSDTGYAVIVYNVENATEPVRFEGAVKGLIGRVSRMATRRNERFGWGAKKFTVAVTIRGMAQCTRDLFVGSCRECLELAVSLLMGHCRYRMGCQVLYSTCVVRYEIYDFLFEGGFKADVGGDLVSREIILP